MFAALLALMQRAEIVIAPAEGRIMESPMRARNEFDCFIWRFLNENLHSTGVPSKRWFASDGIPDLPRLLRYALEQAYEYAKEENGAKNKTKQKNPG